MLAVYLGEALGQDQLAEALWASARRQAEALEGSRLCGGRSATSWGRPSPELQDLHERVLRQDRDLAWRPPEQGPVVSGDPCYGRDEELGRILAAYEAASAGAARW